MSQFSPAPWVISPEEKSKTEVIFNSLKPNNGKLSGDQAKKYLMLSNLPTPTLGQIWQMSDLDNDGKMTLQEFTIAVHLVQAKCRGIELPKVLPYSLKSSSAANHSVFGSSGNVPSSPMINSMNNGSVGMSLGMQPGGILTPTPLGMSSSGMSSITMSGSGVSGRSAMGMTGMSSSFHTAGTHSGFGNGSLAFMPSGNAPGFHTGITGSNTFPRNMHLAQSSMSHSLGQSSISSLDSLGLMSNWNQAKPDSTFQQRTVATRAASMGPTAGSNQFTPSSLPSVEGLQFGSSAGTSMTTSVGSGLPLAAGSIPPASRLKYTQMFKAADHEKNGFIRGEQARQLLIQSGIPPEKLAKIWDLSDINKDGNLDLDEFLIAMHLIDLAKSGQPLPVTLPQELIPATKRFNETAEPLLPEVGNEVRKGRSESVSSIGKFDAVTFEDKRKENYEKGRLELERRRREIQERIQKEKEERERKEREEEERKRKIREEAERRKQQQIENERRQREEMEREQEAQRRKLIEERHAAQLETERQRQREWEQRRKEELLNQKGLEEDIVKGLRLRLLKLKGELNEETTERDRLNATVQNKKMIFNEILASISEMNKSRSFSLAQVTQLQTDAQKIRALVAQLKAERERLDVELNKRDSTTTSEALGGVRASIQQTKSNIPRLKMQMKSMETETANILGENDFNTRQIPTVKEALQIKIDENSRYKRMQEQKKREYLAAKQRIEDEARRVDALTKKKREDEERLRREAEAKRLREEMARKQKEEERRRQKEKEQQAMKIEQERQEESMRRIQSAQAAEKHAQMERAKQLTAEAIEKQRNIKPIESSSSNSKSNTQNLFTASSLKSSAPKDAVLPIPPPKTKSKPVAPPRPKSRPVVSKADKIKAPQVPEKQMDDSSAFGNWDALAELDFSRHQPENDLMKQLKATTAQLSIQSEAEKKNGDIERIREEDRIRQEQEKKQREGERRRQEEERRRQEEKRIQEEDMRKKEEARRSLEEDRRKAEEELQRKREEEKRKGEAERRRWEEELKRREEEKRKKEERRKEEERKKGLEEKRRWEMELERQKNEEEEKKQKEKDEIQRKVEEMQKLKKMKKEQQQPITTAESAESETQQAARPVIAKRKAKYKALFPFEARHPDELSVLDGDIIDVHENDETAPPGWLRGTCGGSTGLFPENYVKKLPGDTFSDYVDLDKSATVNNFAGDKTGSAPEVSAVASEAFSQPETNILASNSTQVIENDDSSQPPQKAAKRTALLPKNASLQKPLTAPIAIVAPKTIDVKARTGSFTESAHDRTSSFGSSDGTDGSSSQHGSTTRRSAQGSVKSITSSLEKRECYENVMPPFTIEGPSSTETSVKVPEGLQAVALYPYRGKKDEHLTFNKNDQIIVHEQQDMWWYGESNAKTGWFPKSYVKIIGTIKSPASVGPDDTCDASSVASSTSSVATEHSGGEQNYVGECVALFDYNGLEGDLSFNEGDTIKITKKEGDWWEGVLRGECGFFPANYVKIKEQVEAPKKPEVATVISQFTASDTREISLSPGQLIHVLKKDHGGWWQGELQARGKKRQVGWFPASHVKLLAKSADSPKQSDQPVANEPEDDLYAVPPKRDSPADQVLALFSYTAQNEDELTFYKGSVINVISKEGDWWKGELNGQVGMFPYNYVQLLSDLPDSSAHWEGSFDSAVLKSMSKSERQRQNYIHELINTEEIFMDDLSLTLEIFYNPMAEAGVLTEQELNTVFVNWREIIMCNTKLLKALLVRKTMSVNNKVEAVGDILVEQIPRLTPYIRFCSCQIKACKLLQKKVENDAEFKQFEKKCAGNSRLRQNLPLSSYLLKPLQRITKYPLIIKQIIKYTPEDHHDRNNLEQALEQIEELCSQMNENIRMVESSSRLEWLQSHVNLEGLGEKLVFNSQTNCLGQRKYIHHSTVYKHKSNKELRAFLFNDFLLLTRHHGTSPASRLFTNIFKDDIDGEITLSIYKKPIFLNEVVVKLPIDPEVNETLFCLSHIDRIYTLRAETKNERNVWLTKLQKASEHFIETERFQRKRAHRARSVLGLGVGRLSLMIIEGFDLKASDPTGTSDPYCEVSMGSQEHKTKVVPKTLNPKWNSQMQFTVKDIEQDVLCITVFDRDFFSPNDFLGRTELSISSLLKEGPGPWTKRLLLHEVPTGEIILTASFQKFERK